MTIDVLRKYEDIHTHVPNGRKAIVSTHPDVVGNIDVPYSIELHPWHASKFLLERFEKAVEICRNDMNFIAVGECGLDAICDTDMAVQEECFIAALKVAKELRKPVIVHIVRAWDRLFKLIDQYGDLENAPIVIHGFRKNAQMAQQLVARGYYLSLGQKYNVDVPKMIAKDRLFHETDSINSVF